MSVTHAICKTKQNNNDLTVVPKLLGLYGPMKMSQRKKEGRKVGKEGGRETEKEGGSPGCCGSVD